MKTPEETYSQLVAEIDRGNLPAHIAVIMDGNGRWAHARGLSRIDGHRAGVEAVRETVTTCRELGIRFLTLYSFSAENWKRPKAEVSALMQLLKHFLKAELKQMQQKGIRLNVIGRLEQLSPSVQKAIQMAQADTETCRDMQLNLALNYGARYEIQDALQALVGEAVQGRLKCDQLTVEAIEKHLYTAGMPDPALLIRTSGELRVSNFLLWQIAYTELYFTEVLWPDFTRIHLVEAILSYQKRERRFGAVSSEI